MEWISPLRPFRIYRHCSSTWKFSNSRFLLFSSPRYRLLCGRLMFQAFFCSRSFQAWTRLYLVASSDCRVWKIYSKISFKKPYKNHSLKILSSPHFYHKKINQIYFSRGFWHFPRKIYQTVIPKKWIQEQQTTCSVLGNKCFVSLVIYTKNDRAERKWNALSMWIDFCGTGKFRWKDRNSKIIAAYLLPNQFLKFHSFLKHWANL